MNIAIFADLHGRLLLCFKLCARWQRETGQTIDLILQAGDLGAYPNLSRMDRATIKHMRKDPTELGFSNDFVNKRDDVAKILAQTTCPMIFVRGNHEDHEWLDELEQQTDDAIFPVDVYQRVFCIKTGIPYSFIKGDESITILGIGRIGVLPGDPDVSKSKYIQPYELERIYNATIDLHCDVLLTHDVALDFISPNYGMEEIRLVLDSSPSVYHFHGHTEEPMMDRIDANGVTRTIKLADLHWDKSSPQHALEQGAMGILQWADANNHQFDVVDASWINDYNEKTWQKIE